MKATKYYDSYLNNTNISLSIKEAISFTNDIEFI